MGKRKRIPNQGERTGFILIEGICASDEKTDVLPFTEAQIDCMVSEAPGKPVVLGFNFNRPPIGVVTGSRKLTVEGRNYAKITAKIPRASLPAELEQLMEHKPYMSIGAVGGVGGQDFHLQCIGLISDTMYEDKDRFRWEPQT